MVLVRRTILVGAVVCIMVARAESYEHLWHRSLAGTLPNHMSRRVAAVYPYARTICPACSTQLATGFLVRPQCGARFLYADAGPTPIVVPTPGGRQPMEARTGF